MRLRKLPRQSSRTFGAGQEHMLAQSLLDIAEVTIRKAFVRTCTFSAPAERLFERHALCVTMKNTIRYTSKNGMASFAGAGANQRCARSRKRSVSQQRYPIDACLTWNREPYQQTRALLGTESLTNRRVPYLKQSTLSDIISLQISLQNKIEKKS